MCNVLPEKSGIVLTSRELDQNYTATHQLCQGIDVLPFFIKGHPEGNNGHILNRKKLKVNSGDYFVSKYQLYLPTEEELRAEIERDVWELGLMREVIDEN